MLRTSFFEELQDTLDGVPTDDILILLGDFNVRVGRRVESNDVWKAVRGRHGIGICNEVGEHFLEFCSTNNLTIMNLDQKARGTFGYMDAPSNKAKAHD